MMVYQNPRKNWLVVTAILIGAMFFIGAGFLFVIGGYLEATLLVFIGLIVVIGLELRPLLIQPKSISFSNEGIILYLTLNRQRIVAWDRIEAIYAWEGSTRNTLGRFVRKGAITEKNKWIPIDLSFELAVMVKDEYWKRCGNQVFEIWKYLQ